MLSKADIRNLKALASAKGRHEQGLFLAEGHKLIQDLLGTFSCQALIYREELEPSIQDLLHSLPSAMHPKRIVALSSHFDFARISTLQQPQGILATFALPAASQGPTPPSGGLSLLLDNVQDPGNVGTIIRTADWYGVRQIYLGEGCADPFSPKVVQATMGSLTRVRLLRVPDVEALLSSWSGEIIGTFLEGESLYHHPSLNPSAPPLLIMGNEGRGISPHVEHFVTRRVTIPPYSESERPESLNVAIATAILLSHLHPTQ